MMKQIVEQLSDLAITYFYEAYAYELAAAAEEDTGKAARLKEFADKMDSVANSLLKIVEEIEE